MHNSPAKAFDLSIDVDERNLIQNSGSLFPIRPKNPCLHVEGTDGRAIPLCSGSGHGRRLQSAKQPRILRAASTTDGSITASTKPRFPRR
jgi:hypothetical protein